MRFGLLADIHEEVDLLDRAVSALRAQGASRFVVLGDVFETGERLGPTVAALSRLEGAGVWGNHDFGLCGAEVRECFRLEHSPEVLAYFGSLRPYYECDGCWFQHIEPFLDSGRLEDLWCYERSELIDAPRSFASVSHRRIFMGHLHHWRLVTPEGPVAWDGLSPVRLRHDTRYLAVVNAVREGWCAWYDTELDVLAPLRVTA
jgi:hypothetical protein